MVSNNNQQTGFYLDHEVLGLPRLGPNDLDSLVRKADWRTLTAQLSCFSTIDVAHRFFRGETFDDVVAREFVRPDLKQPILDKMIAGGRLVNKFSLATLAKAALRLGEEKNDDGRFPSRENLGEALLTANDQGTDGAGTDPESPQALTAFVRDLSLSPGENLYCKLARYYQLLVEIPPMMTNEPSWQDLSVLFHESMGFDIKRLLALLFGLFAFYGSLGSQLNRRWRGEDYPAPESSQWIIDSATFLKQTHITPSESHELLLALSTNPDRYQSDGTQSKAPFDFTHLKIKPLVHLGDTRFCAPVQDFLIDRLTIGAYFDIINPMSRNQRNTFGGFFGKVFEQYVYALLRAMLGPPGPPLGGWYTPEHYERAPDGPEGPDAIIIGSQRGRLSAIFLEIKSSRPRTATANSGDLAELKRDWKLYLIGTPGERKAARQLDRPVSDFRSGKLSLPGVDQASIYTIYPVIVTLDPWPFYLNIYQDFQEDVASQDLLQQPAISEIDIWSCLDLEMLSPRILAGEALFDIVDQRPRGESHMPLWSQLAKGEQTAGGQSPLLEETWNRFREAIVVDLGLEE
jgi:hypothetical protein